MLSGRSIPTVSSEVGTPRCARNDTWTCKALPENCLVIDQREIRPKTHSRSCRESATRIHYASADRREMLPASTTLPLRSAVFLLRASSCIGVAPRSPRLRPGAEWHAEYFLQSAWSGAPVPASDAQTHQSVGESCSGRSPCP